MLFDYSQVCILCVGDKYTCTKKDGSLPALFDYSQVSILWQAWSTLPEYIPLGELKESDLEDMT